MDYQVLFERPLLGKVETYRRQIIQCELQPGARLAKGLAVSGAPTDAIQLLESLLQTKQPQIFAESAVAGDGSDWNALELSLLRDISIAAEVEVYDDGQHRQPAVHPEPFAGTLIFACGALLANGYGNATPDLLEVSPDGQLNQLALTPSTPGACFRFSPISRLRQRSDSALPWSLSRVSAVVSSPVPIVARWVVGCSWHWSTCSARSAQSFPPSRP